MKTLRLATKVVAAGAALMTLAAIAASVPDAARYARIKRM